MKTTFNEDLFYKITLVIIFIIGILLRCYAFCVFRPLWRDECSLALSIYYGNFIDLWGILQHTQSAPPIFMTICKIFSLINPVQPEYYLRLFPLLSGLMSIYLFFIITKKLFKSKIAIIFANIAFAINTQLIYYSHEFKQYSTDTIVVLGCILYLSKLKLSDLTTKQIVINSILLALFPLLSLPSLFVIAGWILLQIFEKNNIKKLLLALIPLFTINIPYYVFILHPSRKIMLNHFDFLWENGFLSFNFESIKALINTNLAFYFQQSQNIIIPLVLITIGLAILIKRRLYLDKLVLMTLSVVLSASFMTIYPIHERVSLYLLPLVILLAIIPLDSARRLWAKIICFILLCLMLFEKLNFNIINSNYENPDLMMQILAANYQEGDYVIYNDVSDSQFEIYSYIYEFNVPASKCARFQLSDYGEEWYYSILNALPKGKKYWFYYVYDLDSKPVIPFLKNWATKNGKILYENSPNNKSYLLYIQL